MMSHHTIRRIFDQKEFFLIAGPCAIEDPSTAHLVAEELSRLSDLHDIPVIYKSSIRKANRTRLDSFCGINEEGALDILDMIKKNYDLCITSDVHECKDVERWQDRLDLIQIPAFLCRQTDLIVTAAQTMKAVNIKKGQFADAQTMIYAAEKVKAQGNNLVMITERGNTFGYGDLIVDVRNIASLSACTTTVIDASHATQRPNQSNGISSGSLSEIALMGKTGIISGAQGVFVEVHPSPEYAKSDSASMLRLDLLAPILEDWIKLYRHTTD